MGNKLYAGNLPQSATQESLETVFAAIGETTSVNLVMDRDSGNNKGFAFVEMVAESDAEKAIHELDGSMMDGKEIKVNEAKPPRTAGGPPHRASK